LLEEMASNEELSLRVAKINIDENPIVATDYGIRSIPTMLLFSNGELKDTKIGALPKNELEDWIRDNS
jgi:thioredoxin 1